ncbi:hypothetical protein ES288_D04G066000v1 [Gossypium darwinii]|uniref:Uncharacterized protein n=1 Tax=Gossypium darwinii TaxID=34276 RepID=A0A5D2CWA9_GOSDA|nr:hypothetical protein ES288_D04G066000v1 [Gossypium darwinii]TYG73008.1 hypothetical protein ES288_D04G066000v1 [Gossypium darwinii]
MYLKHQLPCLHCQPHDYIRMVQHMIERCLLLQMSRDEHWLSILRLNQSSA